MLLRLFFVLFRTKLPIADRERPARALVLAAFFLRRSSAPGPLRQRQGQNRAAALIAIALAGFTVIDSQSRFALSDDDLLQVFESFDVCWSADEKISLFSVDTPVEIAVFRGSAPKDAPGSV